MSEVEFGFLPERDALEVDAQLWSGQAVVNEETGEASIGMLLDELEEAQKFPRDMRRCVWAGYIREFMLRSTDAVSDTRIDAGA